MSTPRRTNREFREVKELRAVLEAVAEHVPPAYDSYRSALSEWRRRERRRRVVLGVLILVVFVLAVAMGLWVLNRTASSAHGVIYSAAAPGEPDPANPLGPASLNDS